MNEAKESLRSIEQKYKLFQQQQFTFIAALEHCRENAHDKIRPIASIGQVQSYTEHYCNNSTDRRILLMFLDICSELNKLCQHFEALHSGTPVTNNLLEKCKSLVSQSNDLSNLRAKYPHDVVNHLSCDEARNHYGGVVSLIPIVLDLMKEWIAHSEKLPRKALQHVSESQACQEAIGAAATHPSWTTGTQPRLRKHKCRQLTKDSPKPRRNDKDVQNLPGDHLAGNCNSELTTCVPYSALSLKLVSAV
uniref:sperm acrosome-associated protein 9 isoform X2 n=1 Tax=Nyctereutes procyonoides TaxID=34880 RepID=UPI0024443BD0|nr:sperm acrosome-associated protein 9 isoform X2 [Nyctereutes procyonoides]XP_055160788.1 sperm acrosome-associated protein 9 isoform X2 [Nyctereutes procyonoides]XP_055160868.1 sperm acrosome-associated protein 9 isoform X2 [Nyctereutes procyonoides]XP_055160955.1 sperm acrosome-associated protein 9 isoform X2 [Nyctereutes procyonoides]XP_055161037.1 sperm acrosome-associated protein 9 isoform X2 [Nyctereutes procyonoides]XP_055161123.1 sperm acrosome-associated protein 9 isoform X2 [Nyctere